MLLVGAEPYDLIGEFAVLDFTIRSDQEPIGIHARKDAQAGDQPNVGTLRCFDRADAPVVGNMDVTDFEAGAFAVESSGAQRAQTAFVGQLGQRVGLIDHLRELTAAEEVFDGRGNRFGIDQRARRQIGLIL